MNLHCKIKFNDFNAGKHARTTVTHAKVLPTTNALEFGVILYRVTRGSDCGSVRDIAGRGFANLTSAYVFLGGFRPVRELRVKRSEEIRYSKRHSGSYTNFFTRISYV